MLGLDQHLPVSGVEAPGDLARELHVLALVVAHRHLVGLVEKDVGGLEHGVQEKARAHQLLLARRLVLELVHASELPVGGDRAQQPAELGVLVDVGLAKQDAALGIQPAGHQHGRGVEHVAGQRAGVVADAGGVQVDHAIDRRIRPLLPVQIAAHGADVVAEVLAARRLYAAEDSHERESM